MTLQTILYFSSILLTCLLTGFLAWYAWKHQQVPASRAYMRLTLSECFFALAEVFSVLSPSSTTALFWFQARYIAGAFMSVFWFVFALEYSGHRDWISKRLLAGLFVIPFVTQVLLWSNSLHGLWIKQEAGFTQNGALWIADITTRIPGMGYLTHSFYTLILTLAGIALMFLTAWRMRREFVGQALLLAGAGLTAFTFAMNSLFNFLPKTGFNPFTPGIGLSVLLIALSVFRFEFLKRAPADESASLTRLDAQEKYSLSVFLLIFLFFTSGLAAVSTLTYQNYERQFSAQVENQLSAIASLKVDELQNWRNERLADASLFYRNKNFSWRFQRYLENPQDPAIQAELLMWMEKLQAHPEYTRIFLLNPQGIELISIPDTAKTIPEDLIQQASECLASGEIKFLDFHRHSEEDIVHLSILIPVFDAQDGSRPLGVLVLLIDPNIYLYPFIQQWPVPSQSSETLLVRRDEEDVLYLNQLKFEENTALNLRIPLNETQVLAVQAVLGQTGIVHGLDYRGVDVTGDLRAVPDSPWFMVTRMDTEEVYAPLRERLWQTILLFGALVLVAGAGLMLVWRQQRVRFYRGQVEAAKVLRASEEKFRLAFDTSPDAITITRLKDGMFTSVNKGFEQISGYTQDEVVGRTTLEVNVWKNPEDRAKVVEGLQTSGEVRNYEAPFLKKNGEMYGSISASILELNGDPHILSTIRDITERKRAEEALRESRAILQAAMDNSPAGIAIADAPDGKLRYVNNAGLLIRGGDRQSIVDGIGIDQYVASWQMLDLDGRPLKPDEVPLARAVLFGETNSREFIVRRTSNDDRIVLGNAAPIMDERGKVTAGIVIFTDITERKQAEEALRESQEKFRIAQDMSPDGFTILRPVRDAQERVVDFTWIYENAAVARLNGTDPEAVVGRRLLDLFPSHRGTPFLRAYQQVAETGETCIFESGYSDESMTKPTSFRIVVVPMAGDIAVLAQDTTERKQAEEKLVASEVRYRRLFETAKDGILILDAETGMIVDVNPFLIEMLGFSYNEFQGKKIWELGFFKDIVANQANFLELQQNEYIRYEDMPLETADGRRINVEFISNVYQVNHHNVVQCNIRDITERRRAEEKLRYQAALLESVSDAIVASDAQFHITVWNAAAQSLYGWKTEEVLGRNGLEFTRTEWPATDAEKMRLTIAEKGYWRGEATQARKDGSRIPVEVSSLVLRDENGQITGYISANRDITERKRAEEILQEYNMRLEAEVAERTRELREAQEQLVRQERLAALGQLAGSIGHELRNPLGVISNAVYFLKMSQPNASEKIREYLDIIDNETRTSDKIVTDLLDFTRIKSLDRQPVSVSELLRQTLERQPVPPSITLVVDVPIDLPQIYVDPHHILQVLVNLVSNACQAIIPPNSATGTLNVGKLAISAAAQDDMMRIKVRDTGSGIPPENMTKIFEPLFTTKIKGIGLGLAVSRKLTEANNGRIEVESELGKGSTFTVYLPVYKE